MKRIYLLVIFLNLFAGNAFCQKAAKENFLTIAKSYLEFTEKLYRLDSNTTVFRISAGSYKQDSVFFDITFKDVNFMIDEKYTDVYMLNNYKLIFYGPSDKNTNILKKHLRKLNMKI